MVKRAGDESRGPTASPRFVDDLPAGDLSLADDDSLEHVKAGTPERAALGTKRH